jgi:CDP-diacylglycerol pyrophosphatase
MMRTLESIRGLGLGLFAALACASCHHGNPGALWKIVHQDCVPDQQQHSDPKPCALVDLDRGEAGGYAVLKDLNGPYQYLLIPTARVSGVEDPAAVAADAPHWWLAAWQARRFVEQASGRSLPREELSLAINSRYGRSQNQLHIHIDCLKPAVRDALKAHLGQIGQRWAVLDAPLAGRHYRAMRLSEARLETDNPLLLAQDAAPGSDMARQTLVLAGATFEDGSPGFILLEDRATLWTLDNGHGEDLQDHACS